MSMFSRSLGPSMLTATTDTPVVFLQGARQTGKSTLVRSLPSSQSSWRYVTLDDAVVLAAATSDPAGFISSVNTTVVLDEVQRAPELFLAIKAAVDRDRRPGRFVLTGSANILLLPRVSESLAGRMEILTLWPLSQGEMNGVREGFIDAVFADRLPDPPPAADTRGDLIARIIRGGFPEAVLRQDEQRRAAWFGSYLTTVLQRDVRNLANIEGLTLMPRLLTLLATRAATLLNNSELSRTSGIANVTLKRYLTLLETTFLVQLLPPWSGNLSKRLVKSPKVMLADTGLACHLLGLNQSRLESDTVLLGPLMENFVAMELRKQIGWSRTRAGMYHFRTQTGQEVDIVLEDPAGRCVGIEVKASSTVQASDFRGLHLLAQELGPKFVRGVLLYTGTQSVAFGTNLHAMPVDALWRAGSAA
ncbi:MAG: ATP-binding protein [Tepidisphaerales bacterium]